MSKNKQKKRIGLYLDCLGISLISSDMYGSLYLSNDSRHERSKTINNYKIAKSQLVRERRDRREISRKIVV